MGYRGNKVLINGRTNKRTNTANGHTENVMFSPTNRPT